MKAQSSIILAIIFAVLIAIFAVINVDAVPVNYLFGTSEIPLILVILFSVLMGSLLTGAFGFVKVFKLQKEIKALRTKQNNSATIIEEDPKLSELEKEQNNVSRGASSNKGT